MSEISPYRFHLVLVSTLSRRAVPPPTIHQYHGTVLDIHDHIRGSPFRRPLDPTPVLGVVSHPTLNPFRRLVPTKSMF